MIYLIGLVVVTWLVWGNYLSVMHLKHIREERDLPLPFKVFAYPWAILFLIQDILYNLIIGSIIFIEFPHEWLFTARVSRLNDGDDWRGRLARWLCHNLLNPGDPSGVHCK